jgi:hypothetical protein
MTRVIAKGIGMSNDILDSIVADFYECIGTEPVCVYRMGTFYFIAETEDGNVYTINWKKSWRPVRMK